jgi:hypothetical protein
LEDLLLLWLCLLGVVIASVVIAVVAVMTYRESSG